MRWSSFVTHAGFHAQRVGTFAVTLLVAAACSTATSGAGRAPNGAATPSVPTAASAAAAGLTESQARDMAREFAGDAPVWTTMSGTFESVFAALAHRPGRQHQPRPGEFGLDRLVWGVQFKISMDLCGPQGGTCEERDALRTIFIDYETGEWLRTSTYAPNGPLPTP
jgi:hypothetical protein